MVLSQFYRDRFERRFPVPMLFFEFVGVEIQRLAEAGDTEVLIEDVIGRCLVECEVCLEPDEADILYAVERLAALNKPEQEEGAPTSSAKKSFATDYMRWLSDIGPEQACLYLAGYDWEHATHLYSRIDRDAVYAALEAKAMADWQDKVVAFESCLFGFGGSYGDSANDMIIDISEKPEEAEAALRSIGF